MILRRLSTENFRNLQPGEHEFHEHTNILVGNNGQGKTNLLEAIYFAATTKSFRTTHHSSLFRFGSATVHVAAATHRQGVERVLSVGLEGGTKRRLLMINGERVPLSAYLRALIVFAYSAERLEVIRGAPEERRRFLDRGIASIEPGFLDDLTRYNRVLKQRNALLHDISVGDTGIRSLDAWDEAFQSASSSVQQARARYAQELEQAMQAILQRHAYHVRDLSMTYRPATGDLWSLRREEVRARMSLTGPQRDQLHFAVAGRPAAEVLSGGEIKTLVLFLKFAKLELFRRRFDEPPLFLLDDIDAELDLHILERLLAQLPRSTQVFATSAKESFLEVLTAGPHRRLTVENGAVTSVRQF